MEPFDPTSYSGFQLPTKAKSGTQGGPEAMREPPLGQPDRGVFDVITGIPSAIQGLSQGNPLEAALMVIPGGRATKGAAKLGREALGVIDGGLAQKAAVTAESAAADAAKTTQNALAKQAAEAVKQNARLEKLQQNFGQVANIVKIDTLSNLPKAGIDPKRWTTAQRKAVNSLQGQYETLVRNRSKVSVDPNLFRDLQKLVMSYPKN